MPRLTASVDLAVLLLVAACAGGTSPSVPASQPAVSEAPASGAPPVCETAPDPGPQVGWNAPATAPTLVPVIVNSQIACGPARFMFSFLDPDNRPVAAPDRSASVAVFDLAADPGTPVATAEGTFLWAIEGSRGVYVASIDFARAGTWGAEFRSAAAGGPEEVVRMTFSVVAAPYGLRIGDAAPAVTTPTLDEVDGDLARITTDPTPDERFYEVSVNEALAAGEPFVLAFATPRFCTSAQCGPTLDIVQALIDDHPGVRFINVEPYQLAFVDGALQPVLDANGQLQVVPAVDTWRLLTEPVVFVVGRDDRIWAIFEGILGTDELEAAITAVE